ncbi:MAG: flavin reductase [Flavobacteriaceae bacterium]
MKTGDSHRSQDRKDGFDPQIFRSCLSQFATGVTVITTTSENGNFGVTANSFSSLSLDPPLVLWSIARSSRSFAAFQKARHFAINILARDQIPVSSVFSSKSEDKFADVAWATGAVGSPVLEGVAAHIECTTENVVDGGDHLILIGRVVTMRRFEKEPLIFAQGRYGICLDHPDMKLPDPNAADVSSQDSEGADYLFRLMYNAFYALTDAFEVHRRAENITVLENRVLVGVMENPGCDIDEISRIMGLVTGEARHAAATLASRGMLASGPSETFSLTAEGMALRQAVARREAEFEAQQVAGLNDEESRTLRQILKRLSARNTKK